MLTIIKTAYLCAMFGILYKKIMTPTSWVFAFALASWVYRWQAGVLLSQLAEPVLGDPKTDLIYWIFNFLGICRLAVHAPFSYIIDSFLILLPIAILFLNFIKNNFPIWLKNILAIFYTVFLFIYIISFNTFQTVHTHYLDGLLLSSVVFWFSNSKSQYLLWQGLRYYTCWVYSCAFFWKLGRGFWNYPLHAKAIILAENGTYLAQHHENIIAKIQLFFIENSSFGHILLDIGMVVQSIFIIGFFTKKLDKWLFVLPFFFHLLTYILLDVAFWEFLVLQGTFLYFNYEESV